MGTIKNIIKKLLGRSLGAQRYQYLFQTIKRNHATRLMEIGTWNGQRALAMIRLAQKFSPAVEYYGYDLFEEMNPEVFDKEISKMPPSKAEVQAKLALTGAKIELYQGFTQKTLPQTVASLPKMDLIFIDGGHSHETVANDWLYAQQAMNEKTVVIFDDYWAEGCKGDMTEGAKLVVDAIDRNKFMVEVLPIQDCFRKDWGVLKIQFARVQLKLQ
ncbi:MAG: class I SAM-dependent methyltransferase [Candidatus Komeilibacteria bacterium]